MRPRFYRLLHAIGECPVGTTFSPSLLGDQTMYEPSSQMNIPLAYIEKHPELFECIPATYGYSVEEKAQFLASLFTWPFSGGTSSSSG